MKFGQLSFKGQVYTKQTTVKLSICRLECVNMMQAVCLRQINFNVGENFILLECISYLNDKDR